MTFEATCDAAQRLPEGVDLHDLREAAQELRALLPNSVLAQLAEEKIDHLQKADKSGCTRALELADVPHRINPAHGNRDSRQG